MHDDIVVPGGEGDPVPGEGVEVGEPQGHRGRPYHDPPGLGARQPQVNLGNTSQNIIEI